MGGDVLLAGRSFSAVNTLSALRVCDLSIHVRSYASANADVLFLTVP